MLQSSELFNLAYDNELISSTNIDQREKRVDPSSRMKMEDEIHHQNERVTYLEDYAQAYTTHICKCISYSLTISW